MLLERRFKQQDDTSESKPDYSLTHVGSQTLIGLYMEADYCRLLHILRVLMDEIIRTKSLKQPASLPVGILHTAVITKTTNQPL